MDKKKERLRFNNEDDLGLLRDVLSYNPYNDNNHWALIHKNIVNVSKKSFTLRAVKEHVEHLLKIWTKEDRANLKKSGTEEEYGEKCQLLQEISDLRKDFYKKPAKPTKNSNQEAGLTARLNATQGMSQNSLLIEDSIIEDYVIFDNDNASAIFGLAETGNALEENIDNVVLHDIETEETEMNGRNENLEVNTLGQTFVEKVPSIPKSGMEILDIYLNIN